MGEFHKPSILLKTQLKNRVQDMESVIQDLEHNSNKNDNSPEVSPETPPVTPRNHCYVPEEYPSPGDDYWR